MLNDPLNAAIQLFDGCLLRQEHVGSGLQHRFFVVRSGVHREANYPDVRVLSLDPGSRFDAVEDDADALGHRLRRRRPVSIP